MNNDIKKSNLEIINIVGNGFDISHGFKTSYGDFWNFLESKAPKDEYLGEFVIFMKKNNFENYNRYWSSIEESVPEIIMELYKEYAFIDSEKRKNSNYDPRKVFLFITRAFWGYFIKWIREVDGHTADEVKQKEKYYKRWFKDNFFFKPSINISFNYTETILDLYDEWNIYYIHGKVANGGKIVFGNSLDIELSAAKKIADENSRNVNIISNDGNIVSLSPLAWTSTFEEVYTQFKDGRFYKDIKNNSEKLKEYLNDYINFRKDYVINIFGHSFGTLDIEYFDVTYKIVKKCSSVKWHFFYYGNDEKKRMKKFVKNNQISRCEFHITKDKGIYRFRVIRWIVSKLI